MIFQTKDSRKYCVTSAEYRTSQHRSGKRLAARNPFARGRDVFTRGLYFFTRGLYFLMSGRDVLLPRISYFSPLSSHFVCNSHFVLSIYMVVLTRKHPTHVAHVAPTLRVGWATWVGCFPLSLSYYAREGLPTLR